MALQPCFGVHTRRRDCAAAPVNFVHGLREALLGLPSNDAEDVMGVPDNLKLCSSMTLFARAEPDCKIFQQVLNKFFDGKMDERTVELLK